MLERLARSLSFRLVGIFLVLAGLFVWGTLGVLRWVYNSDEIRGLISGHLSLHVHYVKEDLGSPPSIASALDITRKVPVDIRIFGPSIDWASDPDFPRIEDLAFGPSPFFSDDPDQDNISLIVVKMLGEAAPATKRASAFSLLERRARDPEGGAPARSGPLAVLPFARRRKAQ